MKSKLLFEKLNTEAINLASDLENGEIQPIDAFIACKERINELTAVCKNFEAVIKEHKDSIISQARELPDGKGEYKFEVRNGSKRFDYSPCPLWSDLKDQIKAREKYLKNAYDSSMSGQMIASEDGEEINLPSAKMGDGTVILKKKK